MNKKYELAVNLQQDFTVEEQAQGRANIGAVSAADVELAILSYASLDANTLRFSFSKLDYDPTVAGVGSGGTWKKVNAKFNNVWDWTASGTSFNNAFENAFTSNNNLVSVIAAGDTSAVTNMAYLFRYCGSLVRICLFDTSAVTNMNSMFTGCTSLTSVPLFNTSAVTNMGYMLASCFKVEGGALALYQQASTQATPPSYYANCFSKCGKDTATGEAELAQIPTSWGGTFQEPSANTLRFSFSKMDYDPTVAGVGSTGTWKKVSAKFNNVWDWTKSGTSFNSAFENAFASRDNLVSVIAAGDTSAVTDMDYMFQGCSSLTKICLFDTSAVTTMESTFEHCESLTSIPLFDTSAVEYMTYMFYSCESLTSIPLFDTSAVKRMSDAFNGCTKVEGGALALYQQVSAQATPPVAHSDTFKDCGKDNIDGYCELCEVPVAWGGTQALVIEKSQGGTYEATLPGDYTVAGDSVFMPYELEVQHVVYDRSFAASVRSTMWLPFDLNIGAFTDDFDFRIISLAVRNGTIKVIYSAPPASGIIPKNTPISIQRKEQSSTERLEFGTGTFRISTQPTNVPEPIVFEGYKYQPVLVYEYTVFEAATDDLKYYGFRDSDGQLVSISKGAFIHPYKVVIKCSKI